MVQIAAAAHRAGPRGNLSVSIIKNPRPKDHALLLHLNAKLPKILRRIFVHKFLQVGQKNPPNRKSTGHKPQRTVLCGDTAQGLPIWRIGFYTVVWRIREQKSRVPLSESGARPFGKGNRSFVGSTSMSMRGNGEKRKGAALFPGNSGKLLHQAADGLRVSGGGHPRAGPQ